MTAPPTPRTPLGELAALFLRLGATAFGGPAAHVALMEHEVVRRRGWLTREEFLDLHAATHLVPGPNSTELAIHIGQRRAGWPGLLVAGIAFILPAALLVGALAAAYVRWGTLPQATALLRGVQPVVVAVVAQALWSLGRTALRTPTARVVAAAALAATLAGAHELAVLAGAGLAAALTSALPTMRRHAPALLALAPAAAPSLAAAAPALVPAIGLWALFVAFLRIGAVLFGSGYVLLAFLRADLVVRLGWLTERQLLDAVAVGQVTPGPLFTTATFVGYLVAGPAGAAVATVGIFLPAFVFVAVSGPLVPRLRRSPVAGRVLDGIVAASLALMAVVAGQLARAALVDPFTLAVAASALLLLRRAVSSTWLVLAGAAAALAADALTGA